MTSSRGLGELLNAAIPGGGMRRNCTVIGGSSTSPFVHRVNLAKACVGMEMVMDQLLRLFSEHGIDIRDTRAVSPPANELVWSNDHGGDSVTDPLRCSERRQWELDMVVSRSENCRTCVHTLRCT